MNIEKGQPGYIKSKKRKSLLFASMEFAIVIILLVTGYVTTGSKKNIFTVIAILGCLPAAKMLVGYIVMIPYKSIASSMENEICEKAPYITKVFDLIITNKDKIMPVDALVITQTTICGYTSNKKTDTNRVSKDIKGILLEHKIEVGTVKVFHEFKPFITRAEGLNAMKSVAQTDTSDIEREMKQTIMTIAM